MLDPALNGAFHKPLNRPQLLELEQLKPTPQALQDIAHAEVRRIEYGPERAKEKKLQDKFGFGFGVNCQRMDEFG